MRKFGGLILLLVIVAIVAALSLRHEPASTAPATVTEVSGYVGGEKLNLLKDPDVVSILRSRYGLDVQFDRRGSIEMARDSDLTGKDFIWPSSQVALEVFKEKHGKEGRPISSELLLNSPIVLYSWGNVTDALQRQGIVQKVANAYYIVDFPKLIRLVNSGASWASIGLPELYGKVMIYSTDPTQSNSGNMFAGLLANVLNGGVVHEADLPRVMPTIRKFFDNQGFMETSSDVIFTKYLNMGVGDKPIIIGYESQMIEYSLAQQPSFVHRINDVRMLYPRPTVWSSHPMIALTDNGRKLIAAMQDPDIQKIAWEKHGFRSGTGQPNNVAQLRIHGVPDTVEAVIPMPSARVMDRIITGLGG